MSHKAKTQRVLKQIVRLERYLNRERFRPMTSRYRSSVLLSLLSKSLTTGRAICALVDAGFPADAFATSRTLMEIFFTVRYISNKDTEKRAARYVNYFAKVRVEWKRIIEAHLPKNAKALKSLDPAIIEDAKKFDSRVHWAEKGVTIRTMATEPDTAEMKSDGQGIDSVFDYDALYFWTSQYVHATVEGIRAHSAIPDEVFRVRMNDGEDKDLENNALFNTSIFICKSFIQVLRRMNEPQPKALNDLFKSVRQLALNDAARRRKKRLRK